MDKLREMSGIFCDKRVPIRLNGKCYIAVVSPVILYGWKCWAVKNKTKQIVSVVVIKNILVLSDYRE